MQLLFSFLCVIFLSNVFFSVLSVRKILRQMPTILVKYLSQWASRCRHFCAHICEFQLVSLATSVIPM